MRPSTTKDNNILSEAYNIIYEAAYQHTDGKTPKPMSWWAKRKSRDSTWDYEHDRWLPRTLPDHGPGEEPSEDEKEDLSPREAFLRDLKGGDVKGVKESGTRGSANGLAHGRTAGPLEEGPSDGHWSRPFGGDKGGGGRTGGNSGGKYDGAKDITEVIKRHTQEAIQELQQMDAAEGGEPRSDEEARLSVYEDLNDHLKYLFADVAYG